MDERVIDIVEETAAALEAYGRVPIAFTVSAVLDVRPVDGGLEGLRLVERAVERPYVKDYDTDPAHAPAAWPATLDVTRWGFLAAYAGAPGGAPSGALSGASRGERVGGAAVAWQTPGLEMTRGRPDLAVLWDVRVAPAWRGRGVGAALFAAAARWAAGRGARRMVVETQNVNVAACRFYARQGCVLGAVHRAAYPDAPGEAQLLWYLELAPAAADRPAGVGQGASA